MRGASRAARCRRAATCRSTPRTNTLIIRDLADRLTAAAELIAHARSPAAAGRDRSAHRADQPQQRARPRHPVGLQRPRRSGARHQHRPGVPAAAATAGTAGDRQRRRTSARRRSAPSAWRSARSTARSISTSACARSRATARAASCRRRASSTQNNVEAEITQGSQIPIQTVVEQHRHGAVQGRRADAARDAADHRVEHRDHAHLRRERRAGLSADAGQRPIPPIDTQRAVTTVLVDDGETTVIGGIYTAASRADARTARRSCTACRCSAGCSRRDTTAATRADELLIFITPRIAK